MNAVECGRICVYPQVNGLSRLSDGRSLTGSR